jgi:NRAMP (natural resistance-associated macrophage protein)-like metal ion transporter
MDIDNFETETKQKNPLPTNKNNISQFSIGNTASQVAEDLAFPAKKVKEYWEKLGPGLTTGASDDDPSGIGTYSQAGAKYGYAYLWLALFTLPLMAVVQEMCARIGMVTGIGLAANIRKYYPKKVLYFLTFLLLFANSFNIGADLGIMSKAMQLLIPSANYYFLLFGFAIFCLLLQVFIPYQRYAKYLKWLSLSLLAYVFSAFFINLDWSVILRYTITPKIHFNKDFIILMTGILGTTISPYLFFWQTSQEVEEQILEGKTTIKARTAITTLNEIKRMRYDVWTGMIFSNLVMFFIMVTCAATLFVNNISIEGAADAAVALRPLVGNEAYLLFSLGIVGIGLLSVPILAGSASYAITESFKWHEGLSLKLKQGRGFYGVIFFAMVLGLAANFLGLNVIQALIYAAVLNGLVAPIILYYIVRISSNHRIMGDWKNSNTINFAGWFVTIFMGLSGVATVVYLII